MAKIDHKISGNEQSVSFFDKRRLCIDIKIAVIAVIIVTIYPKKRLCATKKTMGKININK